MTLDEQGREIFTFPVTTVNLSPLTGTETLTRNIAPSLLENPEMLRSTFALVANSIVEASDLAAEVKALRKAVDEMTLALRVADEREARAYIERNEAITARDLALRSKELADAAYDTVNGQRISAEAEAQDLRRARNEAQDAAAAMSLDLTAALSKVAELEAEILRLHGHQTGVVLELDDKLTDALAKARDFEDLYALAQEDNSKLTSDLIAAHRDRDYWQGEYTSRATTLGKSLDTLASIRDLVG